MERITACCIKTCWYVTFFLFCKYVYVNVSIIQIVTYITTMLKTLLTKEDGLLDGIVFECNAIISFTLTS